MSNENALVNIALQQNANAQQLYSLTEPGLSTAEQFYQTLATGDPSQIFRSISPAAGQIAAQSQGAISNIMSSAPPGGEKNLAIEEAIANRGSTIGSLGAQSYLQAPTMLTQLAGQGLNESQAAANAATTGYGSASTSLGNLGQLQIQNQELAVEQKGQALGTFGSLASSGAELGAAAILA